MRIAQVTLYSAVKMVLRLGNACPGPHKVYFVNDQHAFYIFKDYRFSFSFLTVVHTFVYTYTCVPSKLEFAKERERESTYVCLFETGQPLLIVYILN